MKTFLKKHILIVSLIGIILLIIIVKTAPDAYRRLFGSDTEKCFYKINDIIASYDFDLAGPPPIYASGGGVYTNKEIIKNDSSYEFYYTFGLNSGFKDVVYNISEIIDRINSEVIEKADFGDNKIKISLYFYSGDGSFEIIQQNICRENNIIDKSINIAISDYANFEDTLQALSDFRYISIGGYRGYDINIPEDFDYNIFENFTNLKQFRLDGCFKNGEDEKIKLALAEQGVEDIIINNCIEE